MNVSSLGTYLLTQSLISSGQNQLDKLSQQLSSGQKASSLQDYGGQTQNLLNLQSTQSIETAYNQSNTIVSTYLSAYSTSLGQIQSDASTLQTQLQSFDPTKSSSVSELSSVLNTLVADVGATLNGQAGNRYLFSGVNSRLTQAPVGDISSEIAAQIASGLPATAPVYSSTTAGFNAATATAGTVPFYDTAYSGTQTASAQPAVPATGTTVADIYGTQTATIAANQSTSFGLSSNDPSIQALIYSIQNAAYAVSSARSGLSATGATATQDTANARTYLANALSGVSTALSGGTDASGAQIGGLTALQGSLDATISQVSQASSVNTQTLSNLQTQITDITSVDTSQVAEQITALENQLNGSYKVTASLLNLSLLTYL